MSLVGLSVLESVPVLGPAEELVLGPAEELVLGSELPDPGSAETLGSVVPGSIEVLESSEVLEHSFDPSESDAEARILDDVFSLATFSSTL